MLLWICRGIAPAVLTKCYDVILKFITEKYDEEWINMAAEFKTLTILTVYVGEDVYYQDKPIYKCIFEEARKAGIAGGTVFKCIEGYASQKRGMEKRFLINFTDPINLPVVIQLVDKRERLERIYPFLEKNLQHGMATVQDTQVLMTDYVKGRAAAMEKLEQEGKE